MLGGELAKDIGKDRYIEVPAKAEDGILHVYFVEGDERMGYSPTIERPDKSDKSNALIFENRPDLFPNHHGSFKDDLKLFEGEGNSFTAEISGTTGTLT